MVPALLALTLSGPTSVDELYVDDKATIRWRATGKEVALFGANYCLPSALDFRAAGKVKADRYALVRQDMAHFARMGWDGIRLSFWGDWESCDREGNLIDGERLDLLEYVIAEGEKRGMKFMLSPIVTYDARWPEMQEYPEAHGFSRYFEKSKLGTDPAAILAQQNYLRQLLNHVNPYTKRAMKDEPSIAFIEMINEPWHHSEDVVGSVRYINALVDAVRDTGCKKLTFHNLSQDFGMIKPINESKVDGSTFAWYPTALNANHELRGNFLRYVDRYGPMEDPEVRKKPTLVYEFDLADTTTGYGYPAMTRTFRQFGAQFAAMFSYDMLATAPTNIGWTTHVLNLVYTPKKAAGAIIAAEVMRRMPRFQNVGQRPTNQKFGDFRLEDDRAELVASDAFMHTGTTKSRPRKPQQLRKIVGLGSSPIVRYPGTGLYFLDRIDAGRWRLEVYPDALQIDDPYHDPKPETRKFRLISRTWPMTVRLPDLGASFSVRGINRGNTVDARAEVGTFNVKPGVYVLSGPGPHPALPTHVAGLGLREFVCPTATDPQTDLSIQVPRTVSVALPVQVSAQVASDVPPKSVTVEYGSGRQRMRRKGPYEFAIPLSLPAGKQTVTVTVGDVSKSSVVQVLAEEEPIPLFLPERDRAQLATSRSGEAKLSGDAGKQVLEFQIPTWARGPVPDITFSTYVGDLASIFPKNGRLSLRARAKAGETQVFLTLVDHDGNAWCASAPVKTDWQTVDFDLGEFKPSRWVMLPHGYPSNWSYWSDGITTRPLDLKSIERLQLSLRPDDGKKIGAIEVASILLQPKDGR